jgi:energy-coupling factor transport system substrate-specific component
VRVGRRARLVLAVAAVLSLAAFCWPLFARPGAVLDGTNAPLVLALLLPVVLAVVLVEVIDGSLDSKALAMLGVLSAIGAALRPLGAGTAGVETVFFLLVLAGRVFGPGFGFVLGTTTLFPSALLTGGVGPWLPFQMIGAAWGGLGAGLLPRMAGWGERLLLASYGAVAGLGYGLLLNLSFWPFVTGPSLQLSFDATAGTVANLRAFLLFSLATSLGWDVGRALTNAVLVLVAGRALLVVLRRASHRAAFEAPVEFEPLGDPEPPRGHERQQDGSSPLRDIAPSGCAQTVDARNPPAQ